MQSNYMKYIQDAMSREELFSVAQSLHSAYHPFLLDVQAWQLIENLFPKQVLQHLKTLQESVVGHSIISNMIEHFYPGEKVLKYHLTQKYIQRLDEVSAFEVKLGESRLDFARINGHSYAYEIKTELDSLNKLSKQISDYAACFEFVSVVLHPSHAEKATQLLPEFCGIQTYRLTDEGCKFHFLRKKAKSPALSPIDQVANLTTRELESILKQSKILDIPNARTQRETLIIEALSPKQINTFFKKALKERFRKRWSYLQSVFQEIHPIDVQAFFQTQADPKWIYYKNSFMVKR